MPSLLWIGASILKITALMAIRFAPIWVPIALTHGGWLIRVLRMLGSAYLWGVVGVVIVALYLMALVLYTSQRRSRRLLAVVVHGVPAPSCAGRSCDCSSG